MPGPNPVDFVPTGCSQLALSQCIATRACNLDALAAPDVSVALVGSIGALTSVQLSINEFDVCIIAAVTEAFLAAGEVMPAIPALPSPPDLSSCVSDIESETADVADPIGHLSDQFTVTIDQAGAVTRIET